MSRRAYTLLELLAAMAALCVILLMLMSTTGVATLALKENASSIDSFQQARAAFSMVTRRLSQATLNGYRDYYEVSTGKFYSLSQSSKQLEYRYRSDLHFISGRAADLVPVQVPGTERPTHAVFFQAPLGYSRTQDAPLRSLLNICGYYVQYGTDDSARPDFTAARPAARYRLYEMLQPSEEFPLYPISRGSAWLGKLNTDSFAANSHVLAENIVALIILPQRRVDDNGIAPQYAYDSRAWESPGGRTTLGDLTQNQLPPLVQVTMVVVDEASARHLQDGGDGLKGLVDPTLFQDASQYVQDMQSLQDKLKDRCRYRCFQTTVSLAASTMTD